MEIKPDLNAGFVPTDTAAVGKTREVEGRQAGRHAVQSAGDEVHLSAAGSNELLRARKLEAIEKAVAAGTYRPQAEKISKAIVDDTIAESNDPHR